MRLIQQASSLLCKRKEIYEHDFLRHAILFRERLVKLRKEKGYTQQALADLLGISV